MSGDFRNGLLVPDDVHPDSRTRQFSRWVNKDAITSELYFLLFIEPLLMKLAATRTLVLVMDGSAIARGCVTLMVSVLYAGRALPLAWLVIAGEKGHFPAETHVALLCEVHFAQHPFRVSAGMAGAPCNAPADGGFEQFRPQFETHWRESQQVDRRQSPISHLDPRQLRSGMTDAPPCFPCLNAIGFRPAPV